MFNFLTPKKTIIIDTNFLMIPGELGIDIFNELKQLINEPHQIKIMQGTQQELLQIITKFRSKKEGLNAKLGYILLNQKKIKTITHKETHVDEAIYQYALQNECYVCTQDKELKNRLKQTKAKKIILKQKKYLDFEP